MADEKYSALPDGGGLAAGDEYGVARAGASLRVTPIGVPVLVYRYTVTGSDKASIDTGVDTADAGSNDWTNCDLLEVFLYSRTDDTGVNPSVDVTLNNDGGSNYDVMWNRIVATTSSNVNSSARANIQWQSVGAGVANTSVFAQASLVFPNPTGLVGFKPYFGTFGFIDPGDTTQNQVAVIQGMYRSASAITRLKFAPDTALKKLKVGSQLLIYKRLSS